MRGLLWSHVSFVVCLFSVACSRNSSSQERVDLVVGDKEAFEGLVAFVRNNGGVVLPSLRLSEGPPRGIATGKAVSVGETLISVPSQVLLTGSVASQRGAGCAVARLLSECEDDFDDVCAALLPVEGEGDAHSVRRSLELAVFLVTRLYGQDQGNMSNAAYACETNALPYDFFNPYLRSLPTMQAMLSHPVFAAVDLPCRNALGSTQVGMKVKTMREKWARQWGILVRRVPELQQYRSEEFFHAKLLVLSRAFGTRSEANSPLEPVMVPLGDMLNMDLNDRPEVSWQATDLRTQGFRMTSAKAMPDGSVVLGSYGVRPNDEQYSHYGFFREDQLFEAVPLNLRPRSDKLSKGKATRINTLLAGYPLRVQLQFKPSIVTIFQDVLVFSRVVALVNSNESVPPRWSPESALPLQLELVALESLAAHVEEEAFERVGASAAASIWKPIAFSSSLCSDSCLQYSRLMLEPYGALLDFTQQAILKLNRLLGKSMGAVGKAQTSSGRQHWVSTLFEEWSRQLGPAEARTTYPGSASSAPNRSNISHLSLVKRLRRSRALESSPLL